jgi:hypothetical protein
MNNIIKTVVVVVLAVVMVSCNTDEVKPKLEVPETYEFLREGVSTVSFDGQTTRIAMAEELITALTNPEFSLDDLNGMFNHTQGNVDFSDVNLNSSDKNIRSKTAASAEYFGSNAVLAATIKTEFDDYLSEQVNSVFTNWNTAASAGTAGYIQQAGGGRTRYINAKGLELNQAFTKSLIGGLMMDQALNNYLSTSVLDEGSNRSNNDAEIVDQGKNYTTMEHKWDEAYGYLYGASQDPTNPNATIGDDDSFLNEYIGQVSGDADFSDIAPAIFDAFLTGRAAIVAGRYDIRDKQIQIIRTQLSRVVAVRAVYYLQSGKTKMEEANIDYASAFHSLSEAYGFIYSVQFTHNPKTGISFLSRDQVLDLLEKIYPTTEGKNGFWDVTPSDLAEVSQTLADAFGFTVEQAKVVD